jgi:hypothetical protein
MRRSHLIMLFAVVVSATFGSRSSSGQASRVAETIPRELALALIPAAASGGGDILVGSMPADLAKDFPVPAGARVIGSLITLSYMQVVITVPGTADSALAYTKRTLVAHGWLPKERTIPRQGGLQYGPSMVPPTTYCRLGQGPPDGITASTSFYGPAMTLLRLSRTQSSMCDDSQLSAMGSSGSLVAMSTSQVRQLQAPFSNLPPLYAPGDQRTVFTGCRSPGSAGQRVTQNQQLRLSLSPAEILAHYSRQLDSAGWKRVTQSDSEGVTGSWSKTGGSRDQDDVSITVSPIAGQSNCYSVLLSATYPNSMIR